MSDIQYEIEIIQNLIQSGMLDRAFVEHNKLLDNKDLDLEDRIQLDLIYARLLIELGEYEKAFLIMNNIMSEIDIVKSEILKLGILMYYAISQVFTGKIKEAQVQILEIEKFISRLKKINLKNSRALISELHNLKGIIHFRMNEPDKALEEYNKSIFISKEINFRKDEARTIFNIGSLHDQRAEYKLALYNFSNALTVFESIKYYEGIIPCLTRMKNIYQRLGESDKQYEMDRKAMDYQLHKELRACKIASSRMDIELGKQITDLISERNQLEQKIWQLEFTINSGDIGNKGLASEVEMIATEELQTLKIEFEKLNEELERANIELENVKKERDQYKQSSVANDNSDLIKELEIKLSKEIEEHKKLKETFDNLSKKVEEFKLKINNLDEENKKLIEKVRQLNLRKEIKQDKEELKLKIHDLTQQLDASTEKISALNTKITDKQNKIDKFAEIESRYNTQINNLEKKLREQDQDTLQNKINQLNKEISDIKNSKSNDTRILEMELERIKEELKESKETIKLKSLQDQMIDDLKNENMSLKLEIEKLKADKEADKLKEKLDKLSIELEKEKINKNKLLIELTQYKEENAIEVHKQLLQKDKIITDLRVQLSKLQNEEVSEDDTNDKDIKPVIYKKTKISSKVTPVSQTIKPSEIAKSQTTKDDKIGKVYHPNLGAMNNVNLTDYIESDKLAKNVFETVRQSGSIQLKFLAMRLTTSITKCMEVINNLEKLGVIKLTYSEGNENNPNIKIKV